MGKILIAGGTGLIGGALSTELRRRGNEVLLLSRNAGEGRLVWDGVHSGEWADALVDCQAVVNLAGSPISVKFTDENRKQIISSRLNPTGAIGDAIQTTCLKITPPQWINASAIGFYGNRGSEICVETSERGAGFLPTVCDQWESACLEHPVNCAKTIVRIGVVLSRDGGALPKLETLAKAFLGGQIGDGRQIVSWIHIDDLVNLFCWLIEGSKAGIYNGTAPNPASNGEIMSELRSVVHRPWSPPVPSALLSVVGATFGPDASLLLDSTRAIPQAALEQGFAFEFPAIQEALKDLCTGNARQGTL